MKMCIIREAWTNKIAFWYGNYGSFSGRAMWNHTQYNRIEETMLLIIIIPRDGSVRFRRMRDWIFLLDYTCSFWFLARVNIEIGNWDWKFDWVSIRRVYHRLVHVIKLNSERKLHIKCDLRDEKMSRSRINSRSHKSDDERNEMKMCLMIIINIHKFMIIYLI